MKHRLVTASVAALAATALLATAAEGKRKPLKVKSGTQTTTTTLDGGVSATANCPPKSFVIGGGYVAVPSVGLTRFVATESARVGVRAWRAAGRVFTNGLSVSLTAEAYCARLRGKKVAAVTASAPLAGASFSATEPRATCPRKSRLLSGGFAVTSGDADALATAFVFENAIDPLDSRTWSVKALRGPAASAADVAAVAYCLKSRKGKRGKKKSAIAPRTPRELTGQTLLPTTRGGVASVAAPPCPGKRRGISGGFRSFTPSNPVGAARFTESRLVAGVWTVSAFQFTEPDPPPGSPGPIVAVEYCG